MIFGKINGFLNNYRKIDVDRSFGIEKKKICDILQIDI